VFHGVCAHMWRTIDLSGPSLPSLSKLPVFSFPRSATYSELRLVKTAVINEPNSSKRNIEVEGFTAYTGASKPPPLLEMILRPAQSTNPPQPPYATRVRCCQALPQSKIPLIPYVSESWEMDS